MNQGKRLRRAARLRYRVNRARRVAEAQYVDLIEQGVANWSSLLGKLR